MLFAIIGLRQATVVPAKWRRDNLTLQASVRLPIFREICLSTGLTIGKEKRQWTGRCATVSLVHPPLQLAESQSRAKPLCPSPTGRESQIGFGCHLRKSTLRL